MASGQPAIDDDVTLAILAGGAGSRMGRPKGELKIVGKPILEYLLDRFAWEGPTMLVTAPGREHPPGWEGFDREVSDPVGGMGPLRGILTALEHLITPFVAFATVDMPEVSMEFIHWQLDQLRGHGTAQMAMCRREKLIEPFPSIFRASAKAIIESQLMTGRLSVHALSQHPDTLLLSPPDGMRALIWTNLNHPADVEDYLRRG